VASSTDSVGGVLGLPPQVVSLPAANDLIEILEQPKNVVVAQPPLTEQAAATEQGSASLPLVEVSESSVSHSQSTHDVVEYSESSTTNREEEGVITEAGPSVVVKRKKKKKREEGGMKSGKKKKKAPVEGDADVAAISLDNALVSSISSAVTTVVDHTSSAMEVSREVGPDDDTAWRSGNSNSSRQARLRSISVSAKYLDTSLPVEEQLSSAKEQITLEKAGKRKLFHSLVKLANELRRTRDRLDHAKSTEFTTWYDGGMWRSPSLLPSVLANATSAPGASRGHASAELQQLFFHLVIVTALTRVGVQVSANASSWSDYYYWIYFAIFFSVWTKETSYSTRFDTSDLSATVGTLLTCLAVLFASLTVASPHTDDDQGDDLADDGLTRIMYAAAFVSLLHTLYHVRVGLSTVLPSGSNRRISGDPTRASVSSPVSSRKSARYSGYNYGTNELLEQQLSRSSSASLSLSGSFVDRILSAQAMDSGRGNVDTTPTPTVSPLVRQIRSYAILISVMNALETCIWITTIFILPTDYYQYRWVLALCALGCNIRFPRSFLPNDFYDACAKRGLLFVLLLGFLLQSVVVVASQFFEYQTPTLEHYLFIGATCLIMFCIQLLYIDSDSNVLPQDHALIVHPVAGLIYNLGHFTLLASTTILGCGLNLLTHSYLAATAALPDQGKDLVLGGFSSVLLSLFVIKSMHIKRISADPRNQALFVAAYLVQNTALLLVAACGFAVCLTDIRNTGTAGMWWMPSQVLYFLQLLIQTDLELIVAVSAASLFVVLLSWLDEGVELALYESSDDSRLHRVSPFGIWVCLALTSSNDGSNDTIAEDKYNQLRQSPVGHGTQVETNEDELDPSTQSTIRGLSILSPLLGPDAKSIRREMGYASIRMDRPPLPDV
jgi:low temperature requirement protein LtrA